MALLASQLTLLTGKLDEQGKKVDGTMTTIKTSIEKRIEETEKALKQLGDKEKAMEADTKKMESSMAETGKKVESMFMQMSQKLDLKDFDMAEFVQTKINASLAVSQKENQAALQATQQEIVTQIKDSILEKSLVDRITKFYFLSRNYYDDTAREYITLLATKGDKLEIFKTLEQHVPFFAGRANSIAPSSIAKLAQPNKPLKAINMPGPLNAIPSKNSLLKAKMDALGWLA